MKKIRKNSNLEIVIKWNRCVKQKNGIKKKKKKKNHIINIVKEI
jgi:hypothetical protein